MAGHQESPDRFRHVVIDWLSGGLHRLPSLAQNVTDGKTHPVDGTGRCLRVARGAAVHPPGWRQSVVPGGAYRSRCASFESASRSRCSAEVHRECEGPRRHRLRCAGFRSGMTYHPDSDGRLGQIGNPRATRARSLREIAMRQTVPRQHVHSGDEEADPGARVPCGFSEGPELAEIRSGSGCEQEFPCHETPSRLPV